ncbi:hypothetical protein BDV59DRAFT_188859 [Aspergillus ambiguus]|uniref:uncharacterized protein n=1 Tax=Aspergillus ambiguus TaxID=176160 RepID=UPI003CCCF4F8
MRWRGLLPRLYAISLLPKRSHAWTLVWRDAQNNSFVPSGSSDYPCTEIANPAGMVFEYDSDGDPTTFYVYSSTNCSGDPSGWAENYQSKPASIFLGSFRIVDRSKTTSPTASSTRSTSTVAMATATSRMEESGGVIAGVIVSSVAGVALIAVLVFYCVRQRQNDFDAAAAPVPARQADSGVAVSMQAQNPIMTQLDEHPWGMKPATVARPKRKVKQVVELAEDSGIIEMSDSHRVNEIDDNSRSVQQ